MKQASRGPRTVVYVAVFFTNLLSLSCQVIWARKLSYLFGSTAAVFSTVLSIFLLGLACGALAGGWKADREEDARGTRRLLAKLELFLGAWCFFSLPVFELARGLYLAVFPGDLAPLPAATAKFLVVLAAMIAPTFAIGAAFSVAFRTASDELDRLGRDVSRVYALDTLGAAAGALLAGFVFVPMLGLAGSTRLLGTAAVVLGLLLLRAPEPGAGKKKKKKRKIKKPKAEPAAEPAAGGDAPSPRLAWLLPAFFFSGCAALLLETGWIRYFSLLNGTHVYSSSTVLAGFLGGIGVGSLLVAPRADRFRDPSSAVALLFAATALSGILVLRSAGLFERVYFALHGWLESYYAFQLAVCLFIGLLVVIPTVAMGANFPLVARIATRASEERGFAVGRVFFVNTLGAVVGAFLAEFVVLPGWGFEGLAIAVLALYAFAAAVFFALSRAPRRPASGFAAAAVLAAAVASSPIVWELELPFHALYYHGLRSGSWEAYREEAEEMTVVEEVQGFYGQVAVVRYRGHLLLKHNGKTDAATAVRDNRTQMLIGHLPMVFHPRPEKVLVIGLGGGFTLRAVASHEAPSEITMVEIDPEVVEAAREHFSPYARSSLSDPRAKIVTNDGRNFMESSGELYDVIVSEPPNIWVAGVSGLFTREFYRAADEHLAPGGLLCQWVPLYEMEKEDFQIMLRTVRTTFRHVAFWQIRADLVLLASNGPLSLPRDRAVAKLSQPRVTEDLREIGLDLAKTLDFLNDPAGRPDDIERFLGDGESVNTDDQPVLEFRTARNLFELSK